MGYHLGMKIYFAASVRSGRDDQAIYSAIIEELGKHGTVLTEHLGVKDLSVLGEQEITDTEIFARDMDLLRAADVIVAEVSTPSLGVGYELGQAEALGKRVLCLYRPSEGKRLSAMVAGNPAVVVRTYANEDEVRKVLAEFFTTAV